jgi:hypothetical protein
MTIQAQGRGVIQMSGPREIIPSQGKRAFLKGLGAAYRDYVERERTKLARVEALLTRLGL